MQPEKKVMKETLCIDTHKVMWEWNAGQDEIPVWENLVKTGRSTVKRGHAHHRSIRRCSAREGRPRCFGGAQRGGGTGNANSSRTVQQWSVIPAAMAGVRLIAPVPVAWAARRRLA